MKRPRVRSRSTSKAPRSGGEESASTSSARGIVKGTEVRVLAGPFVGKVGVVQELDGKGGARVVFGQLAARVELDDLTAEKSGRPRLSSSHRRPVER